MSRVDSGSPAPAAAAPAPRESRSWADHAAVIGSSGLGAGYFPFASGTFGTLVAMPFAYGLSLLPALLWWPIVVAFIVVSIVAAQRAGKIFGVVDSRYIVADEFAGLFITVAFLPFTWQTAAAGFFLFRIADIVKPWPASWFDRKVKNGIGVTMDDVVAAVYARAVMELLARMGWLGG